MAINLNTLAGALTGAQEQPAQPRASRDQYGTIALDAHGTPTIMLDGGTDFAPCTCMVGVHHGDRVLAHVVNHKIVVFANVTAPTTDDAQALVAIDKADVAAEAADAAGIAAAAAQADAAQARTDASAARTAAQSAVADAAEARTAATQAQADAASAAQDAASAAQSAQSAAEDAADAQASATAAQGSASSAQASATAAQQSASTASQAATTAQGHASTAAQAAQAAQQDASDASDAATQAQASASNAATSASNAATSASNAAADAAQARTEATNANLYANSALDQLGIVQDVVGVLDWASKHGTFAKTADTAIVSGKVYFTFDGTDYAPVVEPQASQLANYYELSMSEAMNDFILAHLAVTSRGLWVLPNGKGSASDEQHAPGYKLLLASDGSYLYDASGVLVRSDTASGTDFASGNDWHVGGEQAYIFYDASEGTITLGGSNIVLGSGKTLSELVGDVSGLESGKANKATLTSEINASADTVKIDAARVNIEGAAIFTSGRLSEEAIGAVVSAASALSYDNSWTYAEGSYVFTATAWRGSVDISDDLEDEFFSWYLRNESGESLLGHGRTMTVPVASAGYRASVIGGLEESAEFALVDASGAPLLDASGIGITAYKTIG